MSLRTMQSTDVISELLATELTMLVLASLTMRVFALCDNTARYVPERQLD